MEKPPKQIIAKTYPDGLTTRRTVELGKYYTPKAYSAADSDRRRIQSRYSRAFNLFHSSNQWKYFFTLTSSDPEIRENPQKMMKQANDFLLEQRISFDASEHINSKGTGFHIHGLSDKPIDIKKWSSKSDANYCEPVRGTVDAAIIYILRNNRDLPKGMHTVIHSPDIKRVNPTVIITNENGEIIHKHTAIHISDIKVNKPTIISTNENGKVKKNMPVKSYKEALFWQMFLYCQVYIYSLNDIPAFTKFFVVAHAPPPMSFLRF